MARSVVEKLRAEKVRVCWPLIYLFKIFSAQRRGEGSTWLQEGAGVGFLLKIPGAGCLRGTLVIDLLMGLFRGAVFRHGGGALKQPIKQPTETPTSTLALMGRLPSLMGRFPTLMGRFTDFVLRGRFTS